MNHSRTASKAGTKRRLVSLMKELVCGAGIEQESGHDVGVGSKERTYIAGDRRLVVWSSLGESLFACCLSSGICSVIRCGVKKDGETNLIPFRLIGLNRK
jgi:hypothetical protein